MKILLSRSSPSGPHFVNVLCLARRGHVGFDLYQVEQNFTALSRRFPLPWSVEEQEAYFVVSDGNGQKLAYVYFEDEPGRRSAGHTGQSCCVGNHTNCRFKN
jgi:hypothetical protein